MIYLVGPWGYYLCLPLLSIWTSNSYLVVWWIIIITYILLIDIYLDTQNALQHLATIDLLDLCNEAKVERCRASRDLRSCGRLVEHVLTSCGHASLCAECSQRCEICPICRTSLPKSGNILRLRLYNECVDAGLILKDCNDRCQEKEDDKTYLAAEIQRLYSLFDVAMENNLCCLICHCILLCN